MRFVEIKDDPRKIPVDTRHRTRGELIDFFDAFLDSDKKFVRVEYAADEYTHPQSAYVSMAERIRKDKLPIKLVMRNGVIYMIRKDV